MRMQENFRPEGNSGAVTDSTASFKTYDPNRAWNDCNNMKRHLKALLMVIVFFVVLIAVGAALGPTPQTNNTASSTLATASTGFSYQSYQDSTYGFSVQVPAGWTIFRDPSPSPEESASGITPVLSVHPSQGQGFGGSFVVSVDKSAQANSSSLYYEIYKEKLTQIWSSYGITFTSTTNALIGGLPGFVITYTVHFPSSVGGDCPSRDIVTVHKSVGYILSFDDCNANDANSNLGGFVNFASSFDFLA